MRELNQIIIHCSATPKEMKIGVREIRNWHVNDNGWSDIGYHYVIRRDGGREIGRPIERKGAHAKGHNSDSIGICLIGGTEDGKSVFNFTEAQMKTLTALINHLDSKYDIKEVHGHNELSKKDCPCFDVQAWWYGK